MAIHDFESAPSIAIMEIPIIWLGKPQHEAARNIGFVFGLTALLNLGNRYRLSDETRYESSLPPEYSHDVLCIIQQLDSNDTLVGGHIILKDGSVLYYPGEGQEGTDLAGMPVREMDASEIQGIMDLLGW